MLIRFQLVRFFLQHLVSVIQQRHFDAVDAFAIVEHLFHQLYVLVLKLWINIFER